MGPMTTPADSPRLIQHASTVAVDGRAALILGGSGRGKSALALHLMAFGARLVADDRTELQVRDGQLFAAAPSRTRGLIEARGVGILRADPAPPTPVHLAIDLEQTETERLPPVRHMSILGIDIALLHNCDSLHFPAAILQYLRHGLADV